VARALALAAAAANVGEEGVDPAIAARQRVPAQVDGRSAAERAGALGQRGWNQVRNLTRDTIREDRLGEISRFIRRYRDEYNI
jgi:hypothetical protein